ncbi:ABC transporter [Fusobacterium necrophorum BFTR-2]|nr:ABC transporter ATP-binding protein [Fusobacterium necrophorum]KDE69325.1 ABC transporter [Fusobacterium necrophorum BFTR-2]
MKQNRRSAAKIMFQLAGLLKPLWGIMSIAVATGVIGFLFSFGISMFGVYAILKILDWVDLSTVPFGTWSLHSYFVAMAICAFFRGLLHYIEQYCNHFIAFHILAEIRVRLFQVMRRLAPAKIDGENQGNLISMITGDIELLEVFYAHTVSPILIAFVTTVILFLYYLGLHWIYAIYALLGQIFVGILVPWVASRKASTVGMKVRNEIGNLNGEFLDKLRGLREVVQYRRGREMVTRISLLTDNLCAGQRELRNQMALVQVWTDSAIIFVSLLQLILSVFLVAFGTVGMEAAILAGVLQVGSFAPYINLANLGNILSQTFACGERVLSLMEETPAVEDSENAQEIAMGNLSVENLQFEYQSGRQQQVLNGVNLEIKPGEIVGIMGPSGCGKSTLLKLMMRFWDADSGKISLGGMDIKEAKRTSLYSHYNYMTQSTSLFTGTIRDNLLVAKPNASEEEIVEALKKASFYDYVMSLPEKLETVVEEGGKNFSGGERQRIGLTRCFLADRSIFFLDEPTSNLDVQNEAIILKSLMQERKDKTVILVSHRLSTLGVCDRILKMEQGKLV